MGLAHDDSAVRRAAVRALGRSGGPDVLMPLAKYAAGELDVALRAEAMFAIGLAGRAASVEVLAPFLLEEQPVVRAAATRALGLADDERVCTTLVGLLDDPAARVRFEAAQALALIASGREPRRLPRLATTVEKIAERMRSDPEPQVRFAAAAAAVNLAQAELRPALVAALADGDERVRALAARAAARLPVDPTTRAALLARAEDPAFVVVVEVAKALAADADPQVVAWLGARVGLAGRAGHSSHHVRAAAAEALGAMGQADGVTAVLGAALGDPSETVRGTALEALAGVLPRAAAAALLEDARTGRTAAPPTRYLLGRVARAAGRVGGAEGFAVVEALLADREPTVRSAALSALGGFEPLRERARPHLAAALATRDVAVRESAAAAISALQLTGLDAELAAALRDSGGSDFLEARLALLKALASPGGGEKSREHLRAALHDEEPRVRIEARDQLARLGGAIPNLPPAPSPPRAVVPVAGRDFATGAPPPRVRLATTQGSVIVELLPDDAPVHATLFLQRCRAGFYDGLTFHRLVPGFVVQGLDPRGDGYGTGGASLRAEIHPRRYEAGIVGMPDAGLDSGGCQAFFTFAPQPRLDARYTIFGRVVEGMDVVARLDVGDVVDYVVAPPAE